jgi:peptide-O-fucosyltransferase
LLKKLKLDAIFLSTDATLEEADEFKRHLKDYKVFQYEPTEIQLEKFKDGGVAIIDQWICAHAR